MTIHVPASLARPGNTSRRRARTSELALRQEASGQAGKVIARGDQALAIYKSGDTPASAGTTLTLGTFAADGTFQPLMRRSGPAGPAELAPPPPDDQPATRLSCDALGH